MPFSQAAIHARLLTAGLPTFPRTVARLQHLIVEAESPPHVVASVIATDPAISALVIGQANAAGHSTALLTEAIRRIGLGVVMSTAASAVPVPDEQRAALAGCWAQANAVAVLLPILHDYRRHLVHADWDAETLHLVGLVHDLGHVLALSQFPAEYAAAARRLQQGEPDFERLVAAEIGAGTGPLAAIAAVSWSLPSLVSIPMACWRSPNSAPKHLDLVSLVHVAHILAHAAGFTAAGDAFVPAFDDATLSRLNLRTGDLETVLTRMFESMDELELYEGALRG